MTNILTGRVSVTKRFVFNFGTHVTKSMSFMLSSINLEQFEIRWCEFSLREKYRQMSSKVPFCGWSVVFNEFFRLAINYNINL